MLGVFWNGRVAGAERRLALAAVAVLATGWGAVLLVPSTAQAEDFMGETVLSALNFCRAGTVPANGQPFRLDRYSALFSLLGNRYGGDGQGSFAVPDFPENREYPFRTRMTWCTVVYGAFPGQPDPEVAREDGRLSGEVMATGAEFCPTGWEPETAENLPLQGKVTWCRASESDYSDNYLTMGQMMLFSGDACPADTMAADGRVLEVQSNMALFSLMGTGFGGNGVTDFALPAMASPAAGLLWCVVTQGLYPSRP